MAIKVNPATDNDIEDLIEKFYDDETQEGGSEETGEGEGEGEEGQGLQLTEEQEQQLLITIRELDQLCVPIDGAQMQDRANALRYYEGNMDQVSYEPDNVPREEGRSQVTALTLAETIETMLPGLVDIVTDAQTVTIKKRRGQTKEQAKEETDAVYSIIYDENQGWSHIYDSLWDAGVSKIGFTLVGHEKDRFGQECVKIWTVDPGDVGYVTVAQNAEASPVWRVVVRMSDEAFEERFGEEPDQYQAAPITEGMRQAANDSGVTTQTTDNRGVLIYFIKSSAGYLCVTTDYNRKKVLEIEEHGELMLQAWGLYRRPHSLVGWSAYDRVKASQKMNTVLLRNVFDTLQFSQVNRPVIGQQSLLPETIDQLQIDAPGAPVIVKGQAAGAIVPLNTATSSGIDVFGALEFVSADTEGRAGAGRNSQGVNAEALHESMTVGMVMENRQQMRIRTMARFIAQESAVPLHSAVHFMARMCGAQVEVGDKTIDCSTWQDLAGVSAKVDTQGGTETLQIQGQAVKGVLTEMVAAQGGPNGPFASGQNILNGGRFILQAAGIRDVDAYLPAKYEPPAPPTTPPPPDPALVKIQSDHEIAMQQMQADQQLAQMKLMADQRQAELDHEYRMAQLAQQQHEVEVVDQYKRDQAADELDLKKDQFDAELGLKRDELGLEYNQRQDELDADLAKHAASIAVDTDIGGGDVRVGGEPG